MRQTKRLTLSAMMSALAVVLLTMGALIEVLDLTAGALASLCIAFVYIEVGTSYALLAFAVSGVLGMLLFPGSLVPLCFLCFFGIYPIAKGVIEKWKAALWLPCKLLLFNGLLWILMGVVVFLFKLPFFGTESTLLRIGLYVLLNIAFFVYDMFLTAVVRLYVLKYRDKLKNLLK